MLHCAANDPENRINYCVVRYNNTMKVVTCYVSVTTTAGSTFSKRMSGNTGGGEELRFVSAVLIVVKAGACRTSCGAMFGVVRERERERA